MKIKKTNDMAKNKLVRLRGYITNWVTRPLQIWFMAALVGSVAHQSKD